MPVTANPLATLRRYELVARVLRSNIVSGILPEGTVLKEGPLAERLQISRAPVNAALRALSDEGRIRRLDGQGYIVEPVPDGPPRAGGGAALDGLDISPDVARALSTRGTWQHFYEQVEREVAASLIFGEYRLVEAGLADHLGVSRTVSREILGRLHERGLIRKSQSSHWTAGPLTARILRERFQLRAILEPAALRLAEPHIDYAAIDRISASLASEAHRVDDETLEEALFEAGVARAPNTELVDTMRRARFLPLAANRALVELGLPASTVDRAEYHALFDLLARRRIDAAAEELRAHLQLMADKSLARLKIVAVLGSAVTVAPYLMEI